MKKTKNFAFRQLLGSNKDLNPRRQTPQPQILTAIWFPWVCRQKWALRDQIPLQ